MSKLTKLINNPKLFALDFAKKRVNLLENKINPKSNIHSITPKYEEIHNQLEISPYSISHLRSPVVFHCGEQLVVGLGMCESWMKLTHNHKENCLFVIRSLPLYKKLLDLYPARNIIYAKSPTEIESLISEYNVKTICYMSNTANNIHCIRFNHIYHIYVGHFDNTRLSGPHKYFRAYDECWMYSEEKKQELEDSIELRHLNIVNLNNPNKFIIERNSSYITYCVSNLNAELNSYHIIDEIYKVGVSFGKSFSAYTDCKQAGIEKYLNNLGVYYSNDQLLLDMTQVAITDFSEKLIVQLLQNNLPVIVYVPEHVVISDIISDTSILELCYLYSSIFDLNEHLKNILNNNDYLKSQRENLIKYKFGIDCIGNNIFDEKINELFKSSV